MPDEEEWMATTYDIAKIVGVNQSTVSRVLNSRNAKVRVSQKTREKILSVANKINFYPDFAARSLATSSVQTIGVCVFPQETIGSSALGSYHLPRILDGIQKYLNELEYDILLVPINDINCKQLHRLIYQNRVDGLLLLSVMDDAQGLDKIGASGKPVVIVDSYNQLPGAYYVNIHNQQAAMIATNHLISLGHRNIGFLGYMNPSGNKYEADRRKGYEAALKEAGISPEIRNIICSGCTETILERKGNWCFDCGYIGMGQLLERNPDLTAVFCINDLEASGAMAYLAQHGISVPDQISVVGFDNSLLASHLNPSLTTVNHDFENVGYIAAEKLIQLTRSEKAESKNEVYFVSTSLVERASTGPCK